MIYKFHPFLHVKENLSMSGAVSVLFITGWIPALLIPILCSNNHRSFFEYLFMFFVLIPSVIGGGGILVLSLIALLYKTMYRHIMVLEDRIECRAVLGITLFNLIDSDICKIIFDYEKRIFGIVLNDLYNSSQATMPLYDGANSPLYRFKYYIPFSAIGDQNSVSELVKVLKDRFSEAKLVEMNNLYIRKPSKVRIKRVFYYASTLMYFVIFFYFVQKLFV